MGREMDHYSISEQKMSHISVIRVHGPAGQPLGATNATLRHGISSRLGWGIANHVGGGGRGVLKAGGGGGSVRGDSQEGAATGRVEII